MGTETLPSSRHRYAFQSWLLDLASLTLLLGIFYAFWLGHHPLFTPDEGRYSEVAREMVATGDYITPRLNGVAFLDKPVLYYWLQASAIRLFGLSEWALRLWPALLGILGCLGVFATCRVLFNRRTAWLAAILLATSPLYFGGAHYANLDLEVAVLISLTLCLLITGFKQPKGRTRSRLLLLAWPMAALAFLTKGMIALMFPSVIAGLWLISTGQWRTLRDVPFGLGLLLFAAIVLPWYALVEQANPGFLHFFFVTQQVSRFLAHGDFNNQSPLWFYLPIVLAGFLPWSLFLVGAIRQTLRERKGAADGFFLLWFVVVLVFFSIPKSKTIGYILPALPPLAILVARYFDRQWQTPLRSHLLPILLFLVTVAGILPVVAFATWQQPHYHHALWPWLATAAALLSSIGILLLLAVLRGATLATGTRLLAVSGIIFCLVFLGSAKVINRDSVKPIALAIKPILHPEDEVTTWYRYYQDLPIYLQRRITIVHNWQATDIPLHDNWVRELWYGMPFQETKDWLISEAAFWERWRGSHRLVVLLDRKRLSEFAEKSQGTLHVLGEDSDIAWVSNRATNTPPLL